jgi:NYN domain/SAP domain
MIGSVGNSCFIRPSFEHKRKIPRRIAPDYFLPTRALYATSNNVDDIGDTPPSSSLDLLHLQLQQQQRQIDALLQLLQQQQQNSVLDHSHTQQQHAISSSNSTLLSQPPPILFQPPPAPASLPTPAATDVILKPLKAMLFIDGTWLYYSIYERRRECPIIKTYGLGWQNRYDINWTALPDIICEQLQMADVKSPPLELVRSSVYTSYKADTSPASYRYKLFQELQAAGYEVHMMETVGKSEKCVDIQLAVELLHYATSDTDPIDVAVLLTGDKDFMPAMIRTRQKGKRVGVVSMRRGCNRALIDTPGLRDFDLIWLEDYLDRLIVPKGGVPVDAPKSLSAFTLHKVMHDFIHTAGVPRVSSRDMGRYLKYLRIRDSTLLDEMKKYYGGLYQFLTVAGCYVLERDPDERDCSHWIELTRDANDKLMRKAALTKFTVAEKEFFEQYSLAPLLQDRQRAYKHTLLQMADLAPPVSDEDDLDCTLNNTEEILLPESLTCDYSSHTVKELKDSCREFGLPVTGVKTVLLERVKQFVEEQVAKSKLEGIKRNNRLSSDVKVIHTPVVDDHVSTYLKDLVAEYLQANGGIASSRQVGRYLAANKSSFQTSSALKELKLTYGNLNAFVNSLPDSFYIYSYKNTNSNHNAFEFQIVLQQTND